MISSTRGTKVSQKGEEKNKWDKLFAGRVGAIMYFAATVMDVKAFAICLKSSKLLKQSIAILCFLFFSILSGRSLGQESLDSASKSHSAFFKSCKTDSLLSFRSAKGYVPTFFHNLGYQATFPLRLRGKDFIVVGVTLAGTAILIHYDEEIDKEFRPIKEKNPFINKVSPYYTELGDYYGYILLASVGAISMAAHDYRLFRTSLMASQAGITAGLWIRLGKILSSRMRPEAVYVDKEFHSDHWFGPFAQFNGERGVAAYDAFPSGHTGFAFAFATVFAKEYNEHKAIPIALYSMASLVGISRLVEHTHWASDVFLGAIIGYYCGKQVYNNEKRQFPHYKKQEKKSYSYFTPFSNDGVTGVKWTLRY